jgi:aspartokinase
MAAYLRRIITRTSDTILSFGELLSAFIIAEALKQNGTIVFIEQSRAY